MGTCNQDKDLVRIAEQLIALLIKYKKDLNCNDKQRGSSCDSEKKEDYCHERHQKDKPHCPRLKKEKSCSPEPKRNKPHCPRLKKEKSCSPEPKRNKPHCPCPKKEKSCSPEPKRNKSCCPERNKSCHQRKYPVEQTDYNSRFRRYGFSRNSAYPNKKYIDSEGCRNNWQCKGRDEDSSPSPCLRPLKEQKRQVKWEDHNSCDEDIKRNSCDEDIKYREIPCRKKKEEPVSDQQLPFGQRYFKNKSDQ